MKGSDPSMLHHAFERLEVGDRFATHGRTVTESDVHAFAAQTGDLHPQHVDADWARTSAFGERIAHGMLVLSYAVGLAGFDPERVVALRRIADAVFKRPVRLGDTIHVVGSVADARELDDTAGLVTLALKILNQDGRAACRARVDVLWKRDAPALDDPFQPTTDGFVPIPL